MALASIPITQPRHKTTRGGIFPIVNMAQQGRQYDIVVYGASGFTGKFTCEHIVTHLPTDLKWAIAGRSAFKLHAVVNELKALNSDRTPPGTLPMRS